MNFNIWCMIAVFNSCNNKPSAPFANDNSNSKINSGIIYNSANNSLPDSINHLLNIAVTIDTFEYKSFYNDSNPYGLLYFKSGKLFNPNSKSAVALYSSSDSTIKCSCYKESNGSWIKMGSDIVMRITRFSPAFFNIKYDDYNFDGMNDLMIVLYNSMGASYSYGYLLTYNNSNDCLRLHNETIEIANMEIDTKFKTILSVEYSNPNEAVRTYKIERKYKWTNDTLKLFSETKF